MRKNSQVVALNAVGLLFARVSSSFVGLFVGVVLVRHLGATSFGIYSVVFAFLTFFQAITCLGVEGILIKDVIRDPDASSQLAGNALSLKMISGFVAVCAALITSIALRYDREIIYLILLASIGLLFSFSSIYGALLQAYNKIVLSGVTEFVVALFSCAAVMIAVTAHATTPIFVGIQASGPIVVGVVLFFVTRSLGICPSFNFDKEHAHYLLKNSWPMFLTSIFMALNLRVDQMLIFSLLGAENSGVYSSVVKLVESPNIIPATFTSVIFPLFCASHLQSREKFRFVYKRAFKYMALVILPVVAVVSALSIPLMSQIYGERFAVGGPALAVLIWSEIFIFLGGLNGNVILLDGLQRYTLVFNVIGAVMNLFLNMLFIPRYGIVGSALATAISYGIVGIIPQLIIRETRTLMLDYLTSLVTPALSAVPTGIMAFLLRGYGLVVSITCASIVYVVMLFVTRGLDRQDREYFKEIMNARQVKDGTGAPS